jgi:hypothetical protein
VFHESRLAATTVTWWCVRVCVVVKVDGELLRLFFHQSLHCLSSDLRQANSGVGGFTRSVGVCRCTCDPYYHYSSWP